MEKFTSVKGKVMPINIRDIDTDMIIPANFLTSVSKVGYGENVFRRLRDNDPSFPMNQDKFKGSQIIVADDNFGCGSSREHAVWAIHGAGFKAVICKSFADIFFSNSSKNGLVLVVLPNDVVNELLVNAESGDYEVEVSLVDQEVRLPDGRNFKFDYEPFAKHCIENGLDDIDYLLSHKDDIKKFRDNRDQNFFFSALEVNN